MPNSVKNNNNEVRATTLQDFQFFPLHLLELLEKKICIIEKLLGASTSKIHDLPNSAQAQKEEHLN